MKYGTFAKNKLKMTVKEFERKTMNFIFASKKPQNWHRKKGKEAIKH